MGKRVGGRVRSVQFAETSTTAGEGGTQEMHMDEPHFNELPPVRGAGSMPSEAPGPGQVTSAHFDAPSDPQSNQPSPDNPLAYRSARGSSRPLNYDVAVGNVGHSNNTGQAPDPHSNEPSRENPLAFRGPAVLHGAPYSSGGHSNSTGQAPDPHSNEPSRDNPLAFRGAAVLHGAPYSSGAVQQERSEQKGHGSGHGGSSNAVDLHSNEPSADNPLAYREPYSWGRSSRPHGSGFRQ